MDWVSCKVALGGDPANVMYRGPERPVSWPEVLVLQYLHGEESVYDAEFAHAEHSNVQTEKMRLLGIYGKDAIDDCYPGARPVMEMDFPGDRTPVGQKRPERRYVEREAAAPEPEQQTELSPEELYAAANPEVPPSELRRGPGRPRLNPAT
jgi:hypothetical protein